VTEAAYEECHLPLVKKGSVVVAITGQGKTLGNAALLALDTCVSQHLAYIQPRDDRIVPEFLLAYLHQRYQHFREVSSAGGSTKGALTCAFLKSYPCPLPPREEQIEIAAMIEAVERKLAASLSRAQALDALFRSLLHNLMTGKLRVRNPALPPSKEGEP
jgi:type I restriction enzyme S subunit